VPANLLAAPAAPVATMLGLLACLLLPVLPPLGGAAASLAWLPSAWIAAVARFFEGVPAQLPWLPGVVGAVVLAVATVLAVVGLHTRRPGLVVLGGVSVLLVLAGFQGRAIGTSLSRPPDWRVVSCDVGQGSATLLRGSGGIALIDTGDDPEKLRQCLADAGVERIDLLVLTHFDQDHIGAAGEVAGRVGTLLVGPSDGADADRLVEGLASRGALVHRTAAGDHGALGDLSWRAIWPEPDTEPGNGASIALLVGVPGMTSAFLGDLGEESQDALLRTTRVPRVDVVGVAHHGSADQSRELYERLAAPLALVSVGADNDYGHPAPTLLQMLGSLGERVVRTDQSGSAFLVPVEGGVSVWTAGTGGDVGAGG
jgi:competence protein ComEC